MLAMTNVKLGYKAEIDATVSDMPSVLLHVMMTGSL